MNHYSYEEIDGGLREYAQKTMGLSEFREVVEDFSAELKEMGYGIEGGMGRGRGTPPTGEALKLTGLGVEVGLRPGLHRRIPVAQKVGE